VQQSCRLKNSIVISEGSISTLRQHVPNVTAPKAMVGIEVQLFLCFMLRSARLQSQQVG
jgi:hypothetical protein